MPIVRRPPKPSETDREQHAKQVRVFFSVVVMDDR